MCHFWTAGVPSKQVKFAHVLKKCGASFQSYLHSGVETAQQRFMNPTDIHASVQDLRDVSWCSIGDDTPMEPPSPQILGRQRSSGLSLHTQALQPRSSCLDHTASVTSIPGGLAWSSRDMQGSPVRLDFIACVFEVSWRPWNVAMVKPSRRPAGSPCLSCCPSKAPGSKTLSWLRVQAKTADACGSHVSSCAGLTAVRMMLTSVAC